MTVFFRISVQQNFSPKLSVVFSQLAACYRTLEPKKSRTPKKLGPLFLRWYTATLSTYFGTYFIYLPLGNTIQGPVTNVTPLSVPKVLLNLYLPWNPTFHLDIKEITSCLTPNHQKIVLCCSSLAS